MIKKKTMTFNIILLLLPVIDLLTSLATRIFQTNLTVGVIIKGLMMLYFTIYILCLTTSKYRKIGKIIIGILMAYAILYFLIKINQMSISYFIADIIYITKAFFFPILFIGILCLYDENDYKSNTLNNIMLFNLVFYSLVLIIAYVTNTSYNTYMDDSIGYIGWYYSGNEVSAITVLLFPFLYSILQKNKIVYVFLSIICIFAISLIGTKVTFFGILFISIISCFYFFNRKRIITWNLLLSLLTVFLAFNIMLNDNSIQNMNRIVEEPKTEIKQETEIVSSEEPPSKLLQLALKFLSGRDAYIINTKDIYKKNYTLSVQLFGIGFSDNNKINNQEITKLIEIDILDLYFHMGIIGLCIVFFPYVYAFYLLIREIRKSKIKINKKILYYTIVLLLSLAISCISGHVLLNPAVSIYIIIYFILLLGEVKLFEKQLIDNNKVQILALHLGYGGTERATIDLANMLSEKYNVEIISLYNTTAKVPYDLNKNVSINYLTNVKPNKKNFLDAVHHFKIMSIIKEGIIAIRILYLKYFLIKDSVISSDAKYLISTRNYFTKIANKYPRENRLTFAIEHNFIINNRYIKKLKKNTSNIKKLICVSKKEYKIYQSKGLKVAYIPNIVSEDYDGLSNLNKKNLIYVGRLEPEKGVLDLVNVMKTIYTYNTEIVLHIFGDGSLRKTLEDKTKQYDLKIVFHGFCSPAIIQRYYLNSCLFILTSYTESFGIVLLEAMKCGVPCIAFSEATGASDIIINNRNGYLINKRDCNQMAKKVCKYLNTTIKEKKRLQKGAKTTAEKFSPDTIKLLWFELLQNQK